MTPPRLAALVLAGALAAALAQSVYRLPVQVSDSLEPIVVAAHAPSSLQLFRDTVSYSDTTLRPMRYLQARWILEAAERLGLDYTTLFRGVHAALVVALLLVFGHALRVRSWLELSAAAVALTVLAGLHTSVAMMKEAFPVNHFAEVALCALIVLAAARGGRRAWSGTAVVALLAFCLLLIESGVLVWLAIVACAAVRLPGISVRTAVAATLVLALYGGARLQLGITSPGIGSHGSGFGDVFYSGAELRDRFGDRPAALIAYNVTGALASLLLSEPRYGVYQAVAIWNGAGVRPVFIIHLLASLLATAAIAWFVLARRRVPPRDWREEDRIVAVALVIIAANAAMAGTYIKDEIVSVAGVFYAVACYVAVRELLQRMSASPPAAPLAVLLGLLIAAGSALWAFRVVGTHFELRQMAFVSRNDWVDVLPPARPAERPADARELALVRRLKEEALIRPTTTPSDLPRWGEAYWVE